MEKIICLIGKSSTGKDTVYNRLIAERELGLRPLVLYTTRPKRPGETDGVTYHFVSEDELRALEQAHPVIERRVYRTAFGPWIYCTLNDGHADGRRICVTTPAALDGYYREFGRERVLPLYLQVPDGLRLRRAIEREERQRSPSYVEVCRRFLADEDDFSEERLLACGPMRRYDNIDLEDCLRELRRDLAEVFQCP